MKETLKTAGFALAAVALAVLAGVVEPESRAPGILSDQGDVFYPEFKDPQAVRIIEVVDYDEATATARPFQVALEKGRWVLPTHHNYPVEIGDRLARTAGAMIDLKKDQVRGDAVQDHARYGVVDPLDQKTASLTGRGKRVTLRDARKQVLADFIFGKPVEGKAGWRYLRLPGQKRVYAVRTDADPSSNFADWVNAGVLRISSGAIRQVTINSYSIDESAGRLANIETAVLTRDGTAWKMAGAERLNTAAVQAMASTLDGLKIVDVRPKPPSLAEGLKTGRLEMSLETAMSLRQRGYFLSPNGRLLANEGEMTVELANGVNYTLRFGEVAAAGGDNRYLFVTVGYSPERAAKYGDNSGAGERVAKDLTNRFADWYYVISGTDFAKLRLKRKDLAR